MLKYLFAKISKTSDVTSNGIFQNFTIRQTRPSEKKCKRRSNTKPNHITGNRGTFEGKCDIGAIVQASEEILRPRWSFLYPVQGDQWGIFFGFSRSSTIRKKGWCSVAKIRRTSDSLSSQGWICDTGFREKLPRNMEIRRSDSLRRILYTDLGGYKVRL